MKKIALIIIVSSIFNSLNAQMKIFNDGDISIGSTSAPRSGFSMHVHGHSVFSWDASTISSAALIRGLNDYSWENNPDYTWVDDEATGIFHHRSNFMGFSIGGTPAMYLSDAKNLLIGNGYDGGWRVAITAGADSAALSTVTNYSFSYGYAHASYINNQDTKNWVVVYNNDEKFCVYGDGSVWANRSYSVSDSILKENIQTIQGARNKVLALRGVTYNFKPQPLANPSDTTTIISTTPPPVQMGLIAEEVEPIAPEVVGTRDDGIKGIAYQNLIALLIEGFKEQNMELQNMQMQLDNCCNGPGVHRSSGSPANDNSLKNSSSETTRARLDQNQPNPFNTNTKINFFIPDNSVSKALMIFDMQGTLLKQITIAEKGESFITIHANEFKAGMYMYSLIIDGKEIDTKRMILTK